MEGSERTYSTFLPGETRDFGFVTAALSRRQGERRNHASATSTHEMATPAFLITFIHQATRQTKSTRLGQSAVLCLKAQQAPHRYYKVTFSSNRPPERRVVSALWAIALAKFGRPWWPRRTPIPRPFRLEDTPRLGI